MIKVECPGCKAPYQVDERRVPDAGLKMRCPKCATSFVVSKPGGSAEAGGAVALKPSAAAPTPERRAAPIATAPKAAPPKAPPFPDDDDEVDLPAIAPAGTRNLGGFGPPALAGARPPPGAAAKGPKAEPQNSISLQLPVVKPPAGSGPAAQAAFDEDIDLPVVAARGTKEPFGRAPIGRPAAPPQKASPAEQKLALAPPKAPSFGEIDLAVDLPSPAGAAPPDAEMDLPIAREVSSPRGAPPARPKAASAAAKAQDANVRNRTKLFGDTVPDPADTPPTDAKAAPIRVPMPARERADGGRKVGSESRGAAPPEALSPRGTARPRPAPSPPPQTPGFGEIDLPLLADGTDLPSPSTALGLPAPSAGLPVPSAASLPTAVEGNVLPARQQAGLPIATPGSTLPVPTPGSTLPVATPGSTLPVATPGTTLPLATPGTTLPVHSRVPTPMGERMDRLSAPDFSSAPTGAAVHGPGHIAGADIYSGAAYDGRHMDAAFRTEARKIGSSAPPQQEEAEEAPLMTNSGQSVGPRQQVSAPPATSLPSDPRSVVNALGRDAFGSDPLITQAEPKLTRPTSPANIGDFIDRTSIELDLIEPTQTPPPAPQIVGLVDAPESRAAPLSVPDLSTTPSGVLPPVGSRFDYDPLGEAPGEGPVSSDAGTEASLGDNGVGDEAELDDKAGPGNRSPMAQRPLGKEHTPDVPAGPRRPWGKYVLVVAVVGLFAGASLSLVPDIGPFGLNFVSDRINRKMQDGALDKVRELVQTDLEADTQAGANIALGKVKTAQAAYPRHRATAGYAAFVAFSRGLRFGARPEDKAYGNMVVHVASTQQNDFFLLAQAAQDAATGQIARARQTMQGLLEKRPNDVDVAVLAGEVELLTKSGDEAARVWQRAVNIKKVPRTLFGLARAQFAANDMIGAEASAKLALDMSPKHVGARALLAAIVWRNGGREQQALELLSKVTEDGEIRESAGEPELVAAYTQLGQIHLGKSRMTQAEAAFAAALKIDPQAVEALIGNGELFYRSGRFTEAVARYEAAMRADADSVPAKIGMAKTMLLLERAKEAKDLLKKLCETRQNEPLAFYWLGRAEEVLGNKKEAEAAYASAIKVGGDSPQTVDAYVALAQLLSSLGRADDAAARLAEATQRFPGLAALYRARGEVALSAGNYEEAKKELELSLSREDDIGTKFKLGSTLRRMRAFEDAAKLFDSIAESDKDFPGLALERGLLFEETGQSDRATEMYAKALQSAPNDLDLKLRVGSTQVMAGHAKQAEAILRDVYRAKPNSAEVNHFLGRALLVRGIGLAEAKRFLERAAEIDPNRAEYHLYVGWVANELGETTLAESALRRAIELDRNLGDAYWQRGVLLQKQGSALDALSDLKIALEKSPSRFEIYATMAYCYQDQSRWSEAEEAWRKALLGNDQVADWHFRLGKTYITRGNKALATPELDKAVALAESPDKASPGWLAEAHFLLGEAYRATNKESAKRHYRRFLDLAPQNHPYRGETEIALKSLGP